MWPEVLKVLVEDRRELVLSGTEILDRLKCEELDPTIFTLGKLNFLEISNCDLQTICEDIGTLSELTKLSFHNNKIYNLPESIANLSNLLYLDLSFNCVSQLPHNIFNNLSHLQTLILTSNYLKTLPSLVGLNDLHHLILPNNMLEELPETVGELTKLIEIDAAGNSITYIPSCIDKLPCLRRLDLKSNKIKEIPPELCRCGKLRELYLDNNPLKDNRLKKAVNDKHSSSTVLAYLSHQKVGIPKKTKKSNGSPKVTEIAIVSTMAVVSHTNALYVDKSADYEIYKIQVLDNPTIIPIQTNQLDFNFHIFACSISGINFHNQTCLDNFLRFLDNVYDIEIETVSVHDEAFISYPLIYTIEPMNSLFLRSRKRKTVKSALQLIQELRLQAETDRKRRKDANFSKYFQARLKHFLILPKRSVNDSYNLVDNLNLNVLMDAKHEILSIHRVGDSYKTQLSVCTSALLIESKSRQLLSLQKITCDIVEWLLKNTMCQPGDGEVTARGQLSVRPLAMRHSEHQTYFDVYPTAETFIEQVMGRNFEYLL